jgi:glycosyltransferase involved in cell wall biosynthesis
MNSLGGETPVRVAMLIRGHLVPSPGAPEVGGAGRQCLKLSRALVQQGHQVTIFTDRLTARAPKQALVQGVPVVYLNSGRPLTFRKGFRRAGNYLFMLSALSQLARHRGEYDVIHGHSGRLSGFLAVLAGRWLKRKSLFLLMASGARNDVVRLRDDRSLLGARWMMNYLHRCNAVIALNEAALAELVELGFRPEQIALIYNGVELDEIQAKGSYAGDGALRLVFVGRLAPEKGVSRLLAAVALLRQRRPNVPLLLTLIGRGPQHLQLEDQARRLGIASKVTFLGETSDVPGHLAGADVFLLPSHGEGLSNALLEAMAAGLACITTDTAGNNALIHHGQNGLLVQYNEDAQELAAAIDGLAQDPVLRERLGRAARRTVEAGFDIQVTAQRYVELYRRLIAGAAWDGGHDGRLGWLH